MPAADQVARRGFGAAGVRIGEPLDQELGHAVDLILDLGQELSGLESTVVDFTEGHPVVLREGTGDISLFG